MHFLPLYILKLLDALLIYVCPFFSIVEGLIVNSVAASPTELNGEFSVNVLC